MSPHDYFFSLHDFSLASIALIVFFYSLRHEEFHGSELHRVGLLPEKERLLILPRHPLTFSMSFAE
jgi:hypothetical protein